jgi:hypothetical protein
MLPVRYELDCIWLVFGSSNIKILNANSTDYEDARRLHHHMHLLRPAK